MELKAQESNFNSELYTCSAMKGNACMNKVEKIPGILPLLVTKEEVESKVGLRYVPPLLGKIVYK